MQPDVAEYDLALELAGTPEEEAAAPRRVHVGSTQGVHMLAHIRTTGPLL